MDFIESSSPSPHNIAHNITYLGCELFEVAVIGDFTKFVDVQDIESLLSPRKNSVLHIHLASTTTEASHGPPQSVFNQIICKIHDFVKKKEKERVVSANFVEQLIGKCGGLVLLPNAKGETPLHLAARFGHSAIARLLLERAKTFPEDVEGGIGAEIKLIRATTRELNETALHEAARYHHIEVVEILLEMDPDVLSIANAANESPLYIASDRGHKLVVKRILEKVESPAYVGHNGQTALHAAVINSDLEMAEDLLKKEHLRAMLTHADQKGWAPLHYAVKNGDDHMTKLLLGEDETIAFMQDVRGRTALHIAAFYSHLTIMKLILGYCPECSELVDNKGWNALHYALHGESRMAAKIMLQNLSMSNLYNEKDVDGCTPLHHYAKCSHYQWQLLANIRIDKQALNKNNQTALDVAYDDVELPDIYKRQGIISHLTRARVPRSPQVDINQIGSGPSLAFSKEAKDSRLIVATLIATVTFAVAFAPPGGMFQDGVQLGRPILEDTASFKAFMAFDTISLVMSTSAVFIHFFSPLINKSQWLDYYLSEMAFSFISIAIATFMLAFVTGTYAFLGSCPIGITTMIIGLLSLIVFNKVKDLSLRGSSLLTFIKHLTNVLLFTCLGPGRETARQAKL